MANPFPFVAGSVLTAAQLNGIGEGAVTYTPTTANVTVGNGTLTGKYVRVNEFIFGQIKFTLGSTSSIGSNPTFSFPVTGATVVGEITSQVYVLDSGTAFYLATAITSTTGLAPAALNTAGTFLTQSGGFTATNPITWATNDYISISFSYEVA